MSHEHPLVRKRQSDRKPMLIGYTGDSVMGMSQAEGRALARLFERTAQPGVHLLSSLVNRDSTGALHRVVPCTSVGGVAAVV